jgi:hypothetical protein
MLSILLISGAAALELTTAQVARHDRPDDCWLVVDGDVYDVTEWVGAHPGGDTIERGCGKDATWFFDHRDDQGGHSEAARAVLDAYRLGRLGDSVADAPVPAPAPHPHDLNLQRTRLGLTPTADVGPARSIALRVGHHVSTDADVPSGIALQLGYSAGAVDVLVTDEQSAGIGGLEVKVRVLDQHGRQEAPLSVAVVAGGGMGYAAEVPETWAQAVVQRDLLDRRLLLRANGTGAVSPGVAGAARASAGGALEFRPIPVHGVFGEVQVPVSEPGAVAWAAGLGFYTRQHVFALYASSTPSLHPAVLAGPTEPALAIGGSLERAFRLPTRRGAERVVSQP